MDYSADLCRYLLAIEAGRIPTYRDTCARSVECHQFREGYLCAIKSIADALGFTKDTYSVCGPTITSAGHEYLWSHSDPSWAQLQNDELIDA